MNVIVPQAAVERAPIDGAYCEEGLSPWWLRYTDLDDFIVHLAQALKSPDRGGREMAR